MKNHDNMILQKKKDSSSETKLKFTEFCNLTEIENFKCCQQATRKLRQFNELRNKINEQME